MSSSAEKPLDQYAKAYMPSFSYALDNELILNWYPHRIIRQVGKGSLLELGVGHGYATRILNDHFDRHVVLDGSPAIIAQFRDQNPDLSLDLVEGYFENYEADEKFDVICMGFVLEHVEDPTAILKHYRRFLKPGGSLFVTVPNAESMHRRVGLAAGLMTDLFALGEGDKQLGHRQLFSVTSMRQLLERCGYAVTSSEGLFFKPFTTAQIQQLHLSPQILEGLMHVGVTYPELSCAFMTHARLES
ncbi:MAG TPA: class I SAM-dependent methyltransferase [Terriglobales bacterium]|nr:class I SAM-dependent methyltransferase [Terriglobales bacterium]